MSNRVLLRTLKSTRAIVYPHSLAYSRTYIAPARSSIPKTSTPSPIKSQTVFASTGTGVGNPDIVDTLPSTANEVPVPPGIVNDAGNGNSNGFGAELGPDQQQGTDWSKSYHGLSSQAFSKDIAEILLAPIDPQDVEMKPGASIRF
jgi:hypothetical protein